MLFAKCKCDTTEFETKVGHFLFLKNSGENLFTKLYIVGK